MLVLLNEGADIHAKNYQGSTPLDHATRKGHSQLIDILKEAANAKAENKTNSPKLIYLGNSINPELSELTFRLHR